MLANLPNANAALCEIDGTLSNNKGLKRLITPAA